MSSSPITFRGSDDSQSELTNVAVETDTMATESLCAFHGGDVDDRDDCELDVECVACDERERFALLDSPPVTVLTGKILSVYLEIRTM